MAPALSAKLQAGCWLLHLLQQLVAWPLLNHAEHALLGNKAVSHWWDRGWSSPLPRLCCAEAADKSMLKADMRPHSGFGGAAGAAVCCCHWFNAYTEPTPF